MSAAAPMLPSMQQPPSTSLSPWIVIMSLLFLSVALCLIFLNYHRLLYFLSHCCSNNLHSLNPPAGDATTPVQSLINSLPLFTFSSLTRCSNASAVVEADCVICLSRFVSGDTLCLLPLCSHAFHSRCIDAWLSSGHETCPLCRSDINASPTSILLPPASSGPRNGSFRLEIDSVSWSRNDSNSIGRRSYSIGSIDYVMEPETEVVVSNNPVYHSRSWYRLSSRMASFRSSQSFFTGSIHRSEVGEWDVEAGRVVEEISELFGWAAGV